MQRRSGTYFIKYMEYLKNLTDFSTSLERALDEIDPDWRDYPGTIVFGTHTFENYDEKMKLVKKAREKKTPFLGECGGLQMAVVEYARNVLGLDADTTELKPNTPEPVITKLPKLRVGIRNVQGRWESFWHNYTVNSDYFLRLNKDWEITLDSENIAAVMRLRDHPFFVGMQFHAGYNSTASDPHPILKEFINVCKHSATTRHH